MSEICEIIKDLECKKDTYIVLDNLSDAVSGIDLFLSALSRLCADKLHIVASVQSVGVENCSKFLGGAEYIVSVQRILHFPKMTAVHILPQSALC